MNTNLLIEKLKKGPEILCFSDVEPEYDYDKVVSLMNEAAKQLELLSTHLTTYQKLLLDNMISENQRLGLYD